MSLSEQIKSDLEHAIKSDDKICRSTLRLLLSNVHNVEIDQRKKIDDAGIIECVAREIKRRKESIEAFEKGNRPDLVAQEKAELDILSQYLPAQMTREEIIDVAKKVIAEVGATGTGDKGKVMGKLMPQTKGKADGKLVSDIVAELLAKA